MIPRLRRGVRLRADRRGGWLLLAPERGLKLSPSAVEIVQLCGRPVEEMVDALCARHAADRAVIARDVDAFLAVLRARRYLE